MDATLDHRPATHVLCLCRTLQAEFTLKDIVGRLTVEKPEIVHLFADAWTTLLNRHLIRVCSLGDTTTYEVAPEDLSETGGRDDNRLLTWPTVWVQPQKQAHDDTPGSASTFTAMQWPWSPAGPWTSGRKE